MHAFTRREHYSGLTPAETLVERTRAHLLSASTGTGTGTNQSRASTAVRFTDQLALLNRHLRDYDVENARLLALHPDAQVFTSFPEIRLPRRGWSRPDTRVSGRTRQVRFRYAANKRMRHAIDWWAFVAVREDLAWSGVLYTAARTARQGHDRGSAARWSRILPPPHDHNGHRQLNWPPGTTADESPRPPITRAHTPIPNRHTGRQRESAWCI